MFNTKRIKALEGKIEDVMFKFHTYNKYVQSVLQKMVDLETDTIPCSTCKCLIRKEDAIRGESIIIRIEEKETIFTPYYCHSKDCKPKK